MKSALSVLLLCFLLVSCGEEKTVETEKTIQERAEAGDAEAQNSLGWMYDTGVGVPQDYVEAMKWYRKDAEQGHAVGQFNLGLMYFHGSGVQKDMAQATKWIRKAAEQGHLDAKEWLKKNAKEKGE